MGPSPLKDWSVPQELKEQDPLLHKEVECLSIVRTQLSEGKIFAILVEPMQCEEADTGQIVFHDILMMARSFSIPVIFDEVQTGCHLGRSFFWHSQFNLKDEQGNLAPQYVTMATQIGAVISHDSFKFNEEFSTLSAYQGYHCLFGPVNSKDIGSRRISSQTFK